MSVTVMPSPSGLPDVDRQWGGLEPGATYLLVGRGGAGRSAAALRAVQAAVAEGAPCLLLSPRPPAELVEIGAGIGFDLAEAHRAGLLRPLRIPTAAALAEKGAAGLETAYRDLVALVRSGSPSRVVVEDFTPLVQFDSFDRLAEAFGGLAGDLRALGATLVVGLGAPANDASRQLLDVVRGAADGAVHVADDGAVTLDPDTPPADADPSGADRESLLTEVAFESGDGSGVAPPPPVPPPPAPPVGAPGGVAEPESAEGDAPEATVIPPPSADPSLLAPAGERPGRDPADALMAQGYLVESGVPVEPGAEALAPPAAPPEDAEAAFKDALAVAFGGRESGVPFLVVAARMEPGTAHAAHFPHVVASVRDGLPVGGHVLTDEARARVIVLLPGAGAEGGEALFARLQEGLRARIGEDAATTLQAVSAVTVPDAQPFASPDDLLAYAFTE